MGGKFFEEDFWVRHRFLDECCWEGGNEFCDVGSEGRRGFEGRDEVLDVCDYFGFLERGVSKVGGVTKGEREVDLPLRCRG